MDTNIIRTPSGATLSKTPTQPQHKDYNKQVIQSYILTTARYDFNVYEKRIIYALVNIAQSQILGLDFRNGNSCRKIQHDLFGYAEITLPFSDVLKDEDDKHHIRLKQALLSLQKKIIQYEDKNVWLSFTLVVSPKIEKNKNTLSFKIDPVMWDCILNFSKGFRKIELKITMNFDSVYAMRFYELLSGQEKPLTFEIDYLKQMFQVQDKYKLTKDFIKRVVEPAKKELDKHSPYSFEYKINKQGKKFHSIVFHPYKIAANQDSTLEKAEAQKQLSPRWILSSQVLRYLETEYNFKPKEITQWYDLFKEAQDKIDLLGFIAEKKRYALSAKNPKGYLISCIKEVLENHKEENIKDPISQTEIPFDLFENLAKKKTKK